MQRFPGNIAACPSKRETMRKQPQLLKVITDEEVESIHQTSLHNLNELGVQYPNHRMLDRLEVVGCRIDRERQVARFPADVVETALSELPKDFSLCPPDGGPPVCLGDGKLKLSMDQSPDIVDYIDNSKGRKPSEEILKGIAVSNALEHVRLAAGYCLPNDIPDSVGDVQSFKLLWTYSRKAVGSWIYSVRSAETILEMAKTSNHIPNTKNIGSIRNHVGSEIKGKEEIPIITP